MNLFSKREMNHPQAIFPIVHSNVILAEFVLRSPSRLHAGMLSPRTGPQCQKAHLQQYKGDNINTQTKNKNKISKQNYKYISFFKYSKKKMLEKKLLWLDCFVLLVLN